MPTTNAAPALATPILTATATPARPGSRADASDELPGVFAAALDQAGAPRRDDALRGPTDAPDIAEVRQPHRLHRAPVQADVTSRAAGRPLLDLGQRDAAGIAAGDLPTDTLRAFDGDEPTEVLDVAVLVGAVLAQPQQAPDVAATPPASPGVPGAALVGQLPSTLASGPASTDGMTGDTPALRVAGADPGGPISMLAAGQTPAPATPTAAKRELAPPPAAGLPQAEAASAGLAHLRGGDIEAQGPDMLLRQAAAPAGRSERTDPRTSTATRSEPRGADSMVQASPIEPAAAHAAQPLAIAAGGGDATPAVRVTEGEAAAGAVRAADAITSHVMPTIGLPMQPSVHAHPPAAVAHAAAIDLPMPLNAPAFAPALGARLVTLVRDGIEQAELRVNPAELGPVAVHIRLDGTQAQIDFSAAHALTRQVLQEALPTLAAALRDSGLTLAGGGVFDQPRPPRDDAARDPSQRGARSDANPSVPAAATRAAPHRARVQGVLDVFA